MRSLSGRCRPPDEVPRRSPFDSETTHLPGESQFTLFYQLLPLRPDAWRADRTSAILRHAFRPTAGREMDKYHTCQQLGRKPDAHGRRAAGRRGGQLACRRRKAGISS